MELIECDKYLISTDGKHHGHPSKQALARIICSQKSPCLIFNYDLVHKIFTDEELANKNFSVAVENEVKL